MLSEIEKRYNPENDVRVDGPRVTWAEYDLYLAIVKLQARVEALEVETPKPPTIPEADNGMDAQAAAVAMAQSLDLDATVRVVAKSGKIDAGGHNWSAQWDGLNIRATFGAGTNSASVQIVDQKFDNLDIVYEAADYGRHIGTFRYGPWVHRLIEHANEIRQRNEATRIEAETIKAKADAAKFEEVDF